MYGAGTGGGRTGTGEVSNPPSNTHASTGGDNSGQPRRVVTRSDLERTIVEAANSKEIKSEILDRDDSFDNMDIGEPGLTEGDVLDLSDSNDEPEIMEQYGGQPPVVAPVVTPPDLGQSYLTVRAARNAASSQWHLNPAPHKKEVVSTGSFLNEGDDRIGITHVEHNLRTRTSKSLSFDPLSKKCITCVGGGACRMGGGWWRTDSGRCH